MNVSYVLNFRDAFGHLAVFFWSDISPDSIGVIWRPRAFMPAKYNVTNARNRTVLTGGPVSILGGDEGENDVEPVTVINVASVVAEMLAMSNGIADRVEFL